jgi:hypothetical protein
MGEEIKDAASTQKEWPENKMERVRAQARELAGRVDSLKSIFHNNVRNMGGQWEFRSDNSDKKRELFENSGEIKEKISSMEGLLVEVRDYDKDTVDPILAELEAIKESLDSEDVSRFLSGISVLLDKEEPNSIFALSSSAALLHQNHGNGYATLSKVFDEFKDLFELIPGTKKE